MKTTTICFLGNDIPKIVQFGILIHVCLEDKKKTTSALRLFDKLIDIIIDNT